MFRKLLAALLTLITLGPPAYAQLEADQLWEQATLYRDEWGVPHVYAQNTRAMAFAFGYAQAEDHLEGMLMAYRAANGRAAEVQGEIMAPSDEFAIRMRHAELAEAAYDEAGDLTRDLCEGLALGVNTWLLEHLDTAPPWAEGVNPQDVLALMHSYLMSMAPFDLPGTYHPSKGTPSANAWAVGPSMSESGAATLVINPHADYEGVYQWYEAHLSDGDYEMAGATLYGLPMILQGHNSTLGWALSPNDPDIADLYMEGRIPPRRTAPVKAYYVRTEDGLDQRFVSQFVTARGPVVAWRDGSALSYKIGGYGEFGAIEQMFEMGRARSMTEFTDALSLHQLPTFHVTYADQAGNIFYRYNAKAARKTDRYLPGEGGRKPKSIWTEPVSAADPDGFWGDVIPEDELPTVVNPKSGYVQSCGTTPWAVTDTDVPRPEDWPGWLSGDLETMRAARVRQLFSLGPRSVYDHRSMLYDLVLPVAPDAVAMLLRAAEENRRFVRRAHPDLMVGLDMLREWNYLATPDSPAMTYFHLWWAVLQVYAGVRTESLPELTELIREDSPEMRYQALLAAEEAAKLMRNEFQTMFVPWGEVHRVTRGERNVGLAGGVSGEPLFMSWDRDYEDGVWSVTSGYGYAMVVSFGEKVEAVSVSPFGTSDNPDSPHYDDQLELLVERRFKHTRFEREEIESHAQTARGKGVLLRASKTDCGVYVRSESAVDAYLGVAQSFTSDVPSDIAAFTAFIEPVVQPYEVPVEIELMFKVPDRVCAREHLEELAVYGYRPETGWRYIEDQWLDPEEREYLALAYEPMVFAVMGASAHRRGDPFADDALPPSPAERPLSVAHSGPVNKPLEPATETEAVPVTEGITSVVLANEEFAGMDTKPDTTAEDRGEAETSIAAGADAPPLERIEVSAPDSVDADSGAGPVAEEPSTDGAVPRDVALEEKIVVANNAVTSAPAETGPVESEKKGEVRWDSRSLAEIQGRTGRPRHESFFLASNPDKASQLIAAREIHLRPPVEGAVFHLTMQKTARAQVEILRSPPAPLPAGTAAFTPVFAVLYQPKTVRGSVAIFLQLEEGMVLAQYFGLLRLYAYHPSIGWQEVPGQKSSIGGRSFSALDFSIRTYAVLGPAEFLLREPTQ